MRKLLWVALFVALLSGQSFGNQYDTDEQTRRDAQRLVDLDRAQREAAKRRADSRYDDEPKKSNTLVDLGLAVVCIVTFVGIPIWLFAGPKRTSGYFDKL